LCVFAKITSLQKENQDLLQERRNLENRLKDVEENIKNKEFDFEKQRENFEKERAEIVKVQRVEMEKHFKAFMEEWMHHMSKNNPEIVEHVKGGVEKLIEGG
jgi:hypothetical protein